MQHTNNQPQKITSEKQTPTPSVVYEQPMNVVSTHKKLNIKTANYKMKFFAINENSVKSGYGRFRTSTQSSENSE